MEGSKERLRQKIKGSKFIRNLYGIFFNRKTSKATLYGR